MVIEGTSRNQEDSEKTLVMLKKSPPGTGPPAGCVDFPRGNGSLDRNCLNFAFQSTPQFGQDLPGPGCHSTFLLGDYP